MYIPNVAPVQAERRAEGSRRTIKGLRAKVSLQHEEPGRRRHKRLRRWQIRTDWIVRARTDPEVARQIASRPCGGREQREVHTAARKSRASGSDCVCRINRGRVRHQDIDNQVASLRSRRHREPQFTGGLM